MVEPLALLIVELSARLAYALERELLDELLHGVHLLVACSMPSEKCEEVNNSLWIVALLAVTR